MLPAMILPAFTCGIFFAPTEEETLRRGTGWVVGTHSLCVVALSSSLSGTWGIPAARCEKELLGYKVLACSIWAAIKKWQSAGWLPNRNSFFSVLRARRVDLLPDSQTLFSAVVSPGRRARTLCDFCDLCAKDTSHSWGLSSWLNHFSKVSCNTKYLSAWCQHFNRERTDTLRARTLCTPILSEQWKSYSLLCWMRHPYLLSGVLSHLCRDSSWCPRQLHTQRGGFSFVTAPGLSLSPRGICSAHLQYSREAGDMISIGGAALKNWERGDSLESSLWPTLKCILKTKEIENKCVFCNATESFW